MNDEEKEQRTTESLAFLLELANWVACNPHARLCAADELHMTEDELVSRVHWAEDILHD